MTEDVKRYVRILLNIAAPLTWIYLACVWGPRLLRFFMPFVVGWLVAMAANAPVRYLERRLRIVRRHSSIAVMVAALAAVTGLIYLAVLLIYRELSAFAADAPALYEHALQEIDGAFANGERLFSFLPDGMSGLFSGLWEDVRGSMGELMSKAAAPTVELAGSVARGIPNAMVNTIVMFLASYLFLAEREAIMAWLTAHLPRVLFRYATYLKRDAKGLIGGYFLAQFRIMFVVAGILAAGLLVLGVRYGLVLAVLIALLDFLPIFGTGTALLPWAAIKLFTGEYAYGAGLILIYILTQAVRQIIQPKIVGDSMGIPPLLTLFLLYIGFKARGIAGMILAVPVGLVFINFYKYGAFDSLIENVRALWSEIERLRRP
jgi:sporulation integral membrane protein YtvI